MEAELEYSDEFHPSSRAMILLMVLSTFWIAFNGAAVIPVGLLATLHYVGTNYETTYFASLRKGWRLVAYSAAITVVTWAAFNPNLNIWSRNGSTGFSLNLVSRGFLF